MADASIDYGDAIRQIECRRKFGKKFGSTLKAFPQFIFPSLLSGEQATSDLLASYHATLIGSGVDMVDLTAGLGIDAMHFAAEAKSIIAVELDSEKVEALRYNALGLGINNLSAVNGDCNDFIEDSIDAGKRYEVAFIDPARRDDNGGRVFALTDCAPDVVNLLPKLREICDVLIIKASPMLDISHTVAALAPWVRDLIVLGTPSECKELIAMLDFRAECEEPVIKAVTLRTDGSATEVFTFTASDERACEQAKVKTTLSEGDYIYEMSPTMMKSGVFRLVAKQYSLSIFHPNTRLFASADAVEQFPGCRYKVLRVLPFASRVLKSFAKEYRQVNVAVRNFGMTADALRKKLGVSDGGELRLYGFTDSRGERVLALVEKG